MDADDGLRASDRTRLVGLDASPDAALVTKERMGHLQGAFDELSDVHTRVLVMRELEGMSYREIGQKLDLTRPAVESALFRARRRLESEYEELSEGRRCEAMALTIMRIARGVQSSCGGAAARTPRAPLPQLPAPRPRAWHRAAVRARRASPEGRGAAAAALAPAPLRRRQRHHGFLRIECQCPAGGTCRGSCGRGGAGGCGRRGTRDWSAGGRPRRGRNGPGRGRALSGGTAARRHRSRHGRGASGNAPGARAGRFRSDRGPRRPFHRHGHRIRLAAGLGHRALTTQPERVVPRFARSAADRPGPGGAQRGAQAPAAGGASGNPAAGTRTVPAARGAPGRAAAGHRAGHGRAARPSLSGLPPRARG